MLRRLVTSSLAIAWAGVCAAGEQPKPPLDRTKPARVEVLYTVVGADGQELGTILSSNRLVLDSKFRTDSFRRLLMDFPGGPRVAIYSTFDFAASPAKLTWLVVDVRNGEWVLFRAEKTFSEEGFDGLKKAVEEQATPTFVGFETRRLRIFRENEASFSATNLPKVFAQAEPGMVAFLQDVRQRMGEARGPAGWGPIRGTVDALAELLALPEVKACSCELKIKLQGRSQDLPEAPAKPLAAEFEDLFGRWAAWAELPRLRP